MRWIGILILLTVIACEGSTTSYQKMLARESLRSDTVHTLFFNYELTMPRQAFYDSSRALNSRGLVTHGPRNRFVKYNLSDTFPFEATMLYYPDFVDDRIAQMRVRFSYDSWAPWNQRLWADSLIYDVLNLMQHWYGSEFSSQEKLIPTIGIRPQFFKIDANRQITIERATDREVLVKITDLHTMPPLEDD